MPQRICSTKVDFCSEASPVIETLYQGDKPPVGADLTGFDLLVLAAKEWQPRARDGHFVGVPEIYHCPLDDDGSRPLDAEEITQITKCAAVVAKYLKEGKKVLSTCNMGLNRSGVISALAMRMAYGFSAERAIGLVRKARSDHALFNRSFVKLIESF
jgi:hypothetical protein